MRRKCKRGIYTSQNIKKCPTCTTICGICRGACKMCHGFSFEDECVSEWHLGHDQKKNWFTKVKKLHKLGVGSLQPGKKFIFYNRKSHKNDRESLRDERKKDRLKKQRIEDEINDGLFIASIDKNNKVY